MNPIIGCGLWIFAAIVIASSTVSCAVEVDDQMQTSGNFPNSVVTGTETKMLAYDESDGTVDDVLDELDLGVESNMELLGGSGKKKKGHAKTSSSSKQEGKKEKVKKFTKAYKEMILPSELKDMKGATGEVPEDSLITVKNGGRMWKKAALAFDMMIKAAKTKRIKFKNIGDYRSLASQEKLFFERFSTVDTSGKSDPVTRLYKGRTWYLRPGYAPCSTPGASNHGLGLAMDIDVKNPRVFKWLVDNGPSFGFYLQSDDPSDKEWEAWHWQYALGDKYSKLVQANLQLMYPSAEKRFKKLSLQRIKYVVPSKTRAVETADDSAVDSTSTPAILQPRAADAFECLLAWAQDENINIKVLGSYQNPAALFFPTSVVKKTVVNSLGLAVYIDVSEKKVLAWLTQNAPRFGFFLTTSDPFSPDFNQSLWFYAVGNKKVPPEVAACNAQ